jgi:hypothetical protein
MRTDSCRQTSMARNPPARLSRASVKVDEIDRLKKGFWRELQAVPGWGPWVKVDIRHPNGSLFRSSAKPSASTEPKSRCFHPEIRIPGWKRFRNRTIVFFWSLTCLYDCFHFSFLTCPITLVKLIFQSNRHAPLFGA